MEKERYITASAAAAELGVSLRGLRHLSLASLLPTKPLEIGRQKLYLSTEVKLLSKRPRVLKPYPRAFVARVLSKEDAPESDRKFVGFTAGAYDEDASPEENEEHRVRALAGWWPCKNPYEQVGNPLVLTLSSFVVATFTITGPGEYHSGRHRFDVTPHVDPETAQRFNERRLLLPKGPVALSIGPDMV